jgi:hypothetical protein
LQAKCKKCAKYKIIQLKAVAMTKAAHPKFASQLFLFGKQHEPEVASWFGGCVVQDWDMEKEDLTRIPELEQMVEVVGRLYGAEYTKVTCVLGEKLNGIKLAKFSGNYPLICKLDTVESYATLEKLALAAREYKDQYWQAQMFCNAGVAMAQALEAIKHQDADSCRVLIRDGDDYMQTFIEKTERHIRNIFTEYFVV